MRGSPNTTAVSVSHTHSPGINKRAIVPGVSETLVSDGNFAGTGKQIAGGATVDTAWTVGANWTAVPSLVSRGAYLLVHETGSTESVSQELPLVRYGWYKIEFTISLRTAGSIAASLGVTDISAAFTDNATVSAIIFFDSATDKILRLTPTSAFDGRIGAVSAVPMTIARTGLGTDTSFDGDGSDWTLTNCSIDEANNWIELWDGVGTSVIKQAVAYTAGQFYIVRLDVSNVDGAGDDLSIALGTTYNSVATPLAILESPSDGIHDISMVPGAGNQHYPEVGGLMNNEEVGYITVEGTDMVDGDETLNELSVLELAPGSRNIAEDSASVTVNPGFTTDTVWTKDSGWTIGAGVATCDGTDGARIYQDLDLPPGQYFLVKFEIPTGGYTSGSVAVEIGGIAGNSYSAVGTHMDIIKAGNDPTYAENIAFLSDSFVGNIDNVEIYQVQGIADDEYRVIDDIHSSYSGSGTVGSGSRLSIVGSGGIKKQFSVPNKKVESFSPEKPFVTTKGDPLVVVLDAPGANVTGRLNATIR